MKKKPLEYTGDLKYQPRIDPNETDLKKRLQSPYIPSPGLVQAVNLALYLQRPLLLQGEPGCGKTLLARAIACEFAQRLRLEFYPYFPWSVKSSSRARDGLYRYDAVGRLRDAQLIGTDSYKTYLSAVEQQKLFARLSDPYAYIQWGALGQAFLEEQYRPIVLIDEIDKADIDFPNDLLRELEEQQFVVSETGEIKEAKQPPIVLITSNSEKDLPDAFLRRCLFYYLEFPSEKELMKIVQAHFPQSLSTELVAAAVEQFIEVREKGASRREGKKASTSELLDWIRWLKRYPEEEALNLVENLADNLPLLGVLLKTKEDRDAYQRSDRRE
jgi:MoxR-like ATPase